MAVREDARYRLKTREVRMMNDCILMELVQDSLGDLASGH